MKFYEALRNRRMARTMKENKKEENGCKYPIGDPRSPGFHFCCSPIERNRFVYCDLHARMCYANYDEIKDKPRRKFGRG